MPEDSSAVAAAALAQPEVHISAPSSGNVSEPAGVDLSESYADLEKAMGEEAPKEVPKADPKAKPASGATKGKQSEAEPSAKDAGKPTKTDQETSDHSQDGKANGEKPLPAPELRKAYQELKAKHAQLQQEYETFKKAPREDPEKKTLAEKLAAAEKHRQQLDEELRHTAYERSQEFKERYHNPFVEAYKLGQEIAAQFKVTDSEGNARQGTAEDFDALMQIPDNDAAARWAEEVYGTTRAAALLNHRMEVIKMARSRNAALQEAQKTAGEREKARQEADMTQRRALAEKWTKLNSEAAEKYPNWFKEAEGDDKGNELLRKGYEFADRAFNGHNLPPEQQVELHSALRNRAAAFGRVAYQNKQQAKRIAELEAKLSEYEKSEPGPGEGRGTEKAEPGEMNWEAQLDAAWH